MRSGTGRDWDRSAGAQLASRRVQMGLTQEDLAARTQLSVRTISDIERGRTLRPRSRSLRLLSTALALDGEPDPLPAEPDPGFRPVLPRQLPLAPRWFAGRRRELHELTALLAETARTAPLAVVSGPAGIGKSTLAVSWAHQVADRFPEGQLYADLHGPADPAEVLRDFLVALHVPAERVPTAPDARAALYRSVLAGRRLLVVLDGADADARVLPLLPGSPGCLTVVTSRDPLLRLVAGAGAHPVRLAGFTPAEALDHLTRALGPDRVAAQPAAVSELIARHGRMPMELGMVAALAALMPELPLAALPRFMSDRSRLTHVTREGTRAGDPLDVTL